VYLSAGQDPSTCLPVCLPTHVYSVTCLLVYLANCLTVSLSTVYLSTFCLLVYLPIRLPVYFYLFTVSVCYSSCSTIVNLNAVSCSGAISGTGRSTILKYCICLLLLFVYFIHLSATHSLAFFLRLTSTCISFS